MDEKDELKKNKENRGSHINVLITGGLGFVGSNLAIECIARGYDVTIFSHSLKNIANISPIKDVVKIIEGDIRNEAAVAKAVEGMDYVFHLAGQTSNLTSMEKPHEDTSINLKGTIMLLEAIRKCTPKPKVIFSGTSSQLGRAQSIPINENMRDNPLSIYEADKLICEKYLRIYFQAYNIETACLRFPTIYGDRQRLDSPRFGITNYFIGRIIRGEDITVYGDGLFIRDYLYIKDVVNALLICAKSPKANGEIFLIGSGRRMYFLDMVKEVIKAVDEIMHKQGNLKFVEFPKGHHKIDVGDTLIDASKIKAYLGWQPKFSFEEGIRSTVSFYVDNYSNYM